MLPQKLLEILCFQTFGDYNRRGDNGLWNSIYQVPIVFPSAGLSSNDKDEQSSKMVLPLLFLLGQTDKPVEAGFLTPLSDSV